jgi:chitin synthase
MPARFEDVPLPYSSAKPLPQRAPTLKRQKTLTRPERHVAPVPLIAPPPTHFSDGDGPGSPGNRGWCGADWNWWVIWSYATTWWAPPALLSLFGIKEKQSRQAWREKITLCWIAVLLGAIVGFATMGLQRALCPEGEGDNQFRRLGTGALTLGVAGRVVNVSTSLTQEHVDFYALSTQMPGQDITNLFKRQRSDYPSCTSDRRYSTTPLCRTGDTQPATEKGQLQACELPQLNDAAFGELRIQTTDLEIGYSWEQVAKMPGYMVIDGLVVNLSPYMAANPDPIDNDEVDFAIRQVLRNQSTSGKDATMLFHHNTFTKEAIPCIQSRYLAGRIDKIAPGCFVASLFLYTSLVVILGVVFVRFAMACVFNWFISARLVRPPRDLGRNAISPAVMPEGANISVNNRTGTAPWAGPKKLKQPRNGNINNNDPLINLTRIGAELFAVCLVTCYSEGEDSIRGTVESIASTNYSDARKLIWIVCDGMITGHGEKQSTPDVCVSMLEADPRYGNPMPMGYIAVGSGAKRENRAMIYAGHMGESFRDELN